MSKLDPDQKKASLEQKLKIQRQIAFAAGLFQGDVTVRTLLESLAEGVVIIDDSGTILLVNSRAGQMFGYPEKELIGKPHAVLIPERFRKVHEEHEAQFFAEPRNRPMGQLLNLTGRRRDGSDFPIEISLGFIETVNGVLVLALISDITLRKQFEERLRESEEQFHIQVEGVQDYAIFMLDAEGNVQNWNAGAERLKGYQAKEIIGTHVSCFYPEEERNAGKPAAELKEAAVAGRVASEGWRVRKDGSRFWGDMIITALYDKSGKLRGFSKVTHDITARKKAADALRSSEARYRALFRDNPIMIVTLDTDLTMLSVNPVCASQLGYTIEELEGESVLKLFHEDDRPAVAEQLRICLQSPNQVHRWQFRKVRKDGGMLWVEESAQAFNDLNGALNLLVVCQDITERKRAEEALRESEERFRATFNQAAVGIAHVAPDGRWLRINQKYCDVVGYSEEELKALTIKEITHPDDQERTTKQFQLLLQGKLRNYSLEKRYLHKDGSTVWVNLTASMVFDAGGNPIFAVGVAEDITNRKRAEEERERLLVQLDAVLNSINEGVVIADLKGNILTMNPSALVFHEYASFEQVRRQLHQFLDTFELTDLEGRTVPFEQWPLSRALRCERFTDVEVYVKRKDTGTSRIGSYSGTPVQTRSGDVILAVITVRDITERKRAEEEIKNLNASLAARAAELEDVNRDLEAFNYTVAHDLRKPLTVVNGYCQAIRESCSNNLDEACKGYLQAAYDGTWRMNRLIDALLQFSQLTHIEPQRQTVDLSALAQEVAAELRLVEPGHRVTFRIADGMSADGDAALLRVVLDNLLGNAWKYTDTREEMLIEFGIMEVDGTPAYFVRDNGVGFDMADADKLFVPFQRLPDAEACRGFGIGLATVERIIRRHGGRVWAEGEPGKGATFYFTTQEGQAKK